jgi:hypothetical protein
VAADAMAADAPMATMASTAQKSAWLRRSINAFQQARK